MTDGPGWQSHSRWRAATPQEAGRRDEGKVLKEWGAKAHPGSGSGSIPFDGSTDDAVVEVKHAKTSFRLSRAYVQRLWQQSTRRGKRAILVLRFPGYEVVMEVKRK